MLQAPGCSVIINSRNAAQSDEVGLDAVENQLLSAWLSQPDAEDIRFRLRQALHAPEIAEQFDYVLLDCPPRLSPACVNALVAADFVLIPAHLDWAALVAVPQLLHELKALKESGILGHLSILGLVANRTFPSGATRHELEIQSKLNLRLQIAVMWKPTVTFFPTFIRQSACFGKVASSGHEAADLTLAIQEEPAVAEVFQKFANEVKVRVRNECRRHAAASS
jgi:cellulose biosynthesis protein BcsQ